MMLPLMIFCFICNGGVYYGEHLNMYRAHNFSPGIHCFKLCLIILKPGYKFDS